MADDVEFGKNDLTKSAGGNCLVTVRIASLAVMVMREGMPSLELWDGPMLAGTDLDFSLDPVWAGGGDGVADSRSF